MNENYLVTKANTLITSSYDLSLEEQRIILTLASMVQPTDEDFKPYRFKISEFMELLGVESRAKYSMIPKITKGLLQKVLEIKQNDKLIQVAWLSSAEYQKGTGYVELEFSPKLKPFMLGLKEFYTSYKLKNVLELKGKYSIRMYEILKSNEFKKTAEIQIDELREILKANTGSYKIYQNFKNRIINHAQKELKEKTDISFEYDEIKTGRKVTSLKFHIKSNSNSGNELAVTKVTEQPKADYIEKVKQIIPQVTELEAQKIYDSANGNLEQIKEVHTYLQGKKVDNVVGYMISLVKPNAFQKPKASATTDNFNKYEQRKYNFDDLEKGLLGWQDEN